MAFDNAPFPLELSALGIKSTWETTIIKLGGGGEQRAVLWSDALRIYDGKTPTLTLVQYLQIEKHFNGRRGQGRSFPARDRSAYQATVEAFGVGDGITAAFQLSVASGDSGNAYNREIYLPDNPILVYDNATPVVEGAGAGKFTVPYTGANAGLVTFGTAPTAGHVLTWTGTYTIPVRYSVKSLDPSLFIWTSGGTGLVQGPSIPMEEIRYPGEWA